MGHDLSTAAKPKSKKSSQTKNVIAPFGLADDELKQKSPVGPANRQRLTVARRSAPAAAGLCRFAQSRGAPLPMSTTNPSNEVAALEVWRTWMQLAPSNLVQPILSGLDSEHQQQQLDLAANTRRMSSRDTVTAASSGAYPMLSASWFASKAPSRQRAPWPSSFHVRGNR
jgi:hypothetical protein